MAAKKKNDPTERPDLKEALLENIVQESRSISTDATQRSARIGRLTIDHGDTKSVQARLKKEGLDANVSRAIGVYTVTQLVPEAMALGIGVISKFVPMVRYKDKAEYRQDVYGEYLPDMIRRALRDSWTASKASEEAAKVRTPNQRAQKEKPSTLEKALVVIAGTPVKTLAKAIKQYCLDHVSGDSLADHLDRTLGKIEEERKADVA